jgi:hypothetical protein
VGEEGVREEGGKERRGERKRGDGERVCEKEKRERASEEE